MDKKVFADAKLITEIPIKTVLQFIVKEGVALDQDKARLVVEKLIGTKLFGTGTFS